MNRKALTLFKYNFLRLKDMSMNDNLYLGTEALQLLLQNYKIVKKL